MAEQITLGGIHVGDEVEYFIEGGWRMVNGKRVDSERATVRVVKLYSPPQHGQYDLGINHEGSPHEGLLRISEVTRVIPKAAAQ